MVCVLFLVFTEWATVAIMADTEVTASWTGGAGNWTNVTKWTTNPDYPNNGTPAGTIYDAIIGASGTVTLNSNVAVDSITINSNNATLLQTGSVFTVGGLVDVRAGKYQLNSGTLTVPTLNVTGTATALLNGGTFRNMRITGGASAAMRFSQGTLDNTTLAGAASLTSTDSVSVTNGLTLDNATLSLSNAGKLTFSGNQTLGGTGTVVFLGYGDSTFDAILPSVGSILTIGSNVTVRTGVAGSASTMGGTVGGSGGLVNNGIISCEHSGTRLTVTGSNWINNGTIRVSAGTLMLAGTTSTDFFGNIQHTGGDLILATVLDNMGKTLNIDPLGTVLIQSCTINGGIIHSSGSARLTTSNGWVSNGQYTPVLNGVTLDTDLFHNNTNAPNALDFRNGLTLLNHNIYMTEGAKLNGTDASTIGGAGEIIVNDYPGGSNIQSTIGGSATTIGSNILIRTGSSYSNSYNGLTIKTVLNQGTISAESTSLAIKVTNDSTPWTNAGTLKVSSRGLYASGTWTNTGTIIATGGELGLGGTWVNNGTVIASNATVGLGGVGSGFSGFSLSNCNLNIAGTYSTAQIREISKTATSLGIISYDSAVLDNRNDVLTLSGTNGDFRLAGGKILGGTITTTDNHQLVSSSNSIFDGVCLDAPLTGNGHIRGYNVDNRSTIALDGGGLRLYGSWSNSGSIAVANGDLSICDSLALQGSIAVSNSYCSVYATLTTAQIRTIATSKARWGFNDGAVLDNRGDTLTLSQNGDTWDFYGGTITGGTIRSTDATQLAITRSIGYVFHSLIVDGVTLAANVQISGDAAPTIQNGLTLTNNSIITVGGISGLGNGTLRFSGVQTLAGTGTIVLQTSYGSVRSLYSDVGTLTIGSNITIRNIDSEDSASIGKTSAGSIVHCGLLSSQIAAKTITINGAFTNCGIIEARNGGTVLVNNTAGNLSGTQLTGGSWQAYANSTVRMVGTDIQTNAAEIVLDGVSASFYNAASGSISALTNLATNAVGGRFTIRNGRNFTTAGALSNSGTITIGSATTLSIPGGLTNAAAGILTGSGSVAGSILAESDSLIIPGIGVGKLTLTGNLTLRDGAILNYELGALSHSDLIYMASSTLYLNGQDFSDFTFTQLSGFGEGTYTLIDAGTISGRLSRSNLSGIIGDYWATLSVVGNDLLLKTTAVPEPNTFALLAAGLFALLAYAWRRRK